MISRGKSQRPTSPQSPTPSPFPEWRIMKNPPNRTPNDPNNHQQSNRFGQASSKHKNRPMRPAARNEKTRNEKRETENDMSN
jgi:hypothetical protein